MNRWYRRLILAFVQNGGVPEDPEVEARFRAFLRMHIALLPPKLRRTAEIVMDADESISYEDLTERLSREEGRPLAVSSVRQRVSRSGRILEHAVRRDRDRIDG